MVWVFTSNGIADSRKQGPSIYNFTRAGTYSVGRKVCTVFINTDKAVSRLHSEVIVGDTPEYCPSKLGDKPPRPLIKVIDKSKLGTFVKKSEEDEPSPGIPVPEGGKFLNDGDLVIFGTNNMVFRLSFVPLVFCISKVDDAAKKMEAEKLAIEHGVHIVHEWNSACTHFLIQDKSFLSPPVAKAIASHKPVLTLDYLLAFRFVNSADTPLPNPEEFVPQVFVSAGSSHDTQDIQAETPVTVALSSIECSKLFEGFIFFMGPCELYNESLALLLEGAGGVVGRLTTEVLKSSTAMQHRVFVHPSNQKNFKSLKQSIPANCVALCDKLHVAMELRLIEAVLMGTCNFETLLEAPPEEEKVAMSASSDETVDNSERDAEMDTAVSDRGRTTIQGGRDSKELTSLSVLKSSNNLPNDADIASLASQGRPQGSAILDSFRPLHKVSGNDSMVNSILTSLQKEETAKESLLSGQGSVRGLKRQRREDFQVASIGREGVDKNGEEEAGSAVPAGKIGKNGGWTNSHLKWKKEKGALRAGDTVVNEGVPGVREEQTSGSAKEAGESNVDIVYAKICFKKPSEFVGDGKAVPNFKRFRKVQLGVGSGNSYASIVPFAKEPYRESDLQKEATEFMRREKKRKENEEAADELFHADRLKRQKASAQVPSSTGKTALPLSSRPPRGRGQGH